MMMMMMMMMMMRVMIRMIKMIPSVHLRATPTLKSPWEALLQVMCSIPIFSKSIIFCPFKVFQSPNTPNLKSYFQRHGGSWRRSWHGGSLLHSPTSLLFLIRLGLVRPGHLPKLLVLVLLPKHLVRPPHLLLLLLIPCPVPPPVWRRGHPKSGSFREHLWHPIRRDCSRSTFREHLLGSCWEQFRSWRTSRHPHITPFTPPPPKCSRTPWWWGGGWAGERPTTTPPGWWHSLSPSGQSPVGSPWPPGSRGYFPEEEKYPGEVPIPRRAAEW